MNTTTTTNTFSNLFRTLLAGAAITVALHTAAVAQTPILATATAATVVTVANPSNQAFRLILAVNPNDCINCVYAAPVMNLLGKNVKPMVVVSQKDGAPAADNAKTLMGLNSMVPTRVLPANVFENLAVNNASTFTLMTQDGKVLLSAPLADLDEHAAEIARLTGAPTTEDLATR